MIKITLIITNGCETCKRAEAKLKEIFKDKDNISIAIVYINELQDQKIFIVPALIINDELFCYGDIDEERLLENINTMIR